MINTVLRRKQIARVSQTPGKTRAIHFYLINERLYLVDLPGYGYAKVSKSISATWGPLVSGYLERSPHLRLIFVLLDARRVPSEEDLGMLEWMSALSLPWQVVLTKSDKLSNNQLARGRKVIAEAIGCSAADLIPFSRITGRGVEEFWKRIEQHL